MSKTVEELVDELKKKDPDNKELYDLLIQIVEKPTKRLPRSRKSSTGEVYIPSEELLGSLKAKPNVVGYSSYAYFAKKYKIPLIIDGRKKTMKELSESIHKYEMKHKNKIFKKGIDENTGTYGLYLVE
jgi:hypothetical protein